MKKKFPAPAAGFLICCLVILRCLCGTAAASTDLPADQAFDRTLELEGISFHVQCSNASSLNEVTIVPRGLAEVNRPIHLKDVDGMVYGAEVADINQDGSPEIYVYVASAGSGSYGSLIAYSANNKKSLSEIYLAPLEDDKVNSRGYMGHDSFSVSRDRLIRKFPLYKKGDSNAEPSGGIRILEYKLVPGEATWQLKLVKSTDQPSTAS